MSLSLITRKFTVEEYEKMATVIKMGLPHLHNTEEGWNSAYNIRFQGAEQTDSEETLPDPKNQYHIAGDERLLLCNSIRPKYGLLHH